MEGNDINARYLNVGYRKRDDVPGETAAGREPMGRKGIGKLSVFSIAETVEVYSTKNGERHAFRMNSDDIQRQIADPHATGDYYPEALDLGLVDFDEGTKLVLKDLKKGLARSAKYLRRRLARRFSVIGGAHGFEVVLDGAPIEAKDRGYYEKIEFLWHLGDLERLDDGFFVEENGRHLRENIRKHFEVSGVVDADEDWTAHGWIGTVDEQKSIDEDNNTIVVLARGMLIHEDVLKDLKEGGVYSKYLIGEIYADFMDANELPDIVTSDRQSVDQDDERYQKLKAYVRTILKSIENQWSGLRNEVGTERALQHPAIQAWYGRLKGDRKKSAQKLFGRIESLNMPDAEAKKEVYKSGMLAFERLSFNDSLSTLENLETKEELELLSRLFGTVDEIEPVHYYEIARGRLEVVKQFEEVLPDAKEKLLQRHIFDQLWLMDPSWERAASNQRIEEAVTKEFRDLDAKLTEEEKKGRIDIRYRTAAG